MFPAAVPEAAVDKDRQAETGKDDVGPRPASIAEIEPDVLAESESVRVKRRPKRDFRSRIAATVGSHRGRGMGTRRRYHDPDHVTDGRRFSQSKG